MGTREFPRIFTSSFDRSVQAWNGHPSMRAGVTSLLLRPPCGGAPVDGSLSGYADDLFKKHLLFASCAASALAALQTSTTVMDEALAERFSSCDWEGNAAADKAWRTTAGVAGRSRYPVWRPSRQSVTFGVRRAFPELRG